MKNYFFISILLILLSLFSTNVWAQQEAQYTQYMYNPLSINPAYAGSREVFSIVGLYRNQWTGIDGAPKTQTISFHTPINENLSLGLNINHDEIFISQETYVDIDVSYKLNFDQNRILSFGIKAGGHLLDVNTNKLNTGAFNNGDNIAYINIDNKFSPQFGAGAYYYTNKFYLGLSIPNLLETEHFIKSNNSNESAATANEKIHYYLLAGYVFDLNDNLKFKPSLLTKLVNGAPLQVDVSGNFLLYDRLSLGAAYRWSASISGMVGFQLTDQLMLGFAYDQETTELKQYNDGSFEVFLRFELFNKSTGLITPRFF